MLSTLKITLLELRLKKSSFFWWCVAWSVLAAFFISVFDTVAGDEALSQDFIQAIPPEMAQSFNISSSYLTQVESFISGQFLTFYLLIGGIFLTIIGINSISGKIQNGQITEYLFSPNTRPQIFSGIYLANLIFILIANLFVTTALFLSAHFLTSQETISTNYFLFFYLGNIVLQFFFLNFGLLCGLILPPIKQVGIGAGLAVASWFINTILNLTDLPENLRLISPFYYFDTALLSNDFELNPALTIVIFMIGIVLLIISYFKWKRVDVEV